MAKHHRRSQSGPAAEMTEITVAVPRDRVGMLKHYAKRLSRNRPAQREEVIYHLHHHAREIEQRFGVSGLWLFGSVVRNESKRQSDVDLLVEFSAGHPEGMLDFVTLKQWLESILSRPVDLVTPNNLKPRLRPRIMREAFRVL
jgi:predicted nucleotidyltransferase